MNDEFRKFIESGKNIALQNEVVWNTPTDELGNISKSFVWNMSQMAGAKPTPRVILQKLGHDKKTRLNWPQPILENSRLDEDWQDLVKTIIVRKLYINRNKPTTIKTGTVRSLLALSVSAGTKPPWELNANDVRKVIAVAKEFEQSGKLANNIVSLTRTIFDQNRLSNFCPITPPEVKKITRQRKFTKEVRKHLTDRKGLKKLPEEEAFWEIVRICWLEDPITSFDRTRFAMVKLLVLCGLRISEASTIPLDCLKWIHLKPLKISGKVPKQAEKQSLALKHFASKKRSQRTDSVPLFETIQHIPSMFKSTVVETVNTYASFSDPMRIRLKSQCETSRIFPEFAADDIIPCFEFYTRLTGEPFLYEDPEEKKYIQAWKKSYDLELLDEIDRRQIELKSIKNLKNRVRQYFQMRLVIKHKNGTIERAPFKHANGLTYREDRLRYDEIYFNVGQLEEFLTRCMPTKLSDTKPFVLRNGSHLYPYELLFLAPKRALAEERNGRICDIRKYAFIGIITENDLALSLSGKNKSVPSLFRKYGVTEKTKSLSITSHTFRHLQNTELFRLGVSDAIITKRFNRNTVLQSHLYDHRSLAEDLKAIEFPQEAEPILSGKAADTYRMIAGGMAIGPIVDEFREIQKTHGDETAYKFLMVEADGLHTTPYGHCINSFTVDPCPKHLECFSGCVHLTRSPLTEHTENLEKTKSRFEKLLESIDDHPAPAAAKTKMRNQAEERLAGLEKMLSTPVGGKVFPEGKDLSRPIRKQFAGPFNDGKA